MAKSTGHSCLGCLGAATAAACLPFVIMAIGDVVGDGNPTVALAMGAMFLVGLVASSWFSLKMFRSQPDGAPRLNEAQLLRLAAAHGARLTVSQVVVSTGVEVEVAQDLLEDMTKKRLAEVMVDDNGAEVFHFVELMSAVGKPALTGATDARALPAPDGDD